MIVKRFVYVLYLRFTDFDFKLFLDDTFYNGISCLFHCKKFRDLFILKESTVYTKRVHSARSLQLAHGWWFSPGTQASPTTKIGRHDIAEISLKVALYTIKIKSKSNHTVGHCIICLFSTYGKIQVMNSNQYNH